MAAIRHQLAQALSLLVVSAVSQEEGPAFLRWLTQTGYQPRFVGMEGPSLDSFAVDLVLLHVPRIDATAVREYRRCLRRWPGAFVIVLAEQWTPALALRVLRQGAWDCLQAGDRATLLAACRRISTRSLPRETALSAFCASNDPAEFTQCAPPAEVHSQLRRCAVDSDPLVLVGEPGTEKQEWAHWMHLQSSRKNTPFLPWAQSALDPQQLGRALSEKMTWAATVFLPDLQQCPLAMQDLLASMLASTMSLDGAPLRAKLAVGLTLAPALAVQRGSVHPGLLPWLHQVVVVPPLRDRIWQLPTLVQRCLHEVAQLQGGQVPRMTQACWRHLQAYAWPANLEELRQVVRAACARTKTRWIGEEDLPESVRAWPHTGLAVSLAQAEERLLRQTLELHRGNKTATAAALGISRRGLYKKLQRLQQGTKGPTLLPHQDR